MINTAKLFLVAAVAAAALASPALAQSLARGAGTVNTISVTHTQRAARTEALQRSGLYDVVMPQTSFAGVNTFGAGSAGGGSVGYNENLRKDQW